MRRLSQRDVILNTDEVTLAWPVPGECIIRRVWQHVDVVNETPLHIGRRGAFSYHGFVLRIPDPSAHTDLDALWDVNIPKSDDDLFFALAPGSAGGPVWEPGEFGDSEHFYDINDRKPTRVFEREEYITFASKPVGYNPTGDLYVQTAEFDANLSRNIRTSVPSALLYALSSPQMTGDVSDAELLPGASDREWHMLKYIDIVMENMIINILGLTETGAESPYEESETFIEQIVSDFNQVDDVSNFIGSTWNVVAWGTMHLSVPGDIKKISITSKGA